MPTPPAAETSYDARPIERQAFSYDNPRLDELTPDHREKLLDSLEILLDISVAFTYGDLPDDALRAALVHFQRAITQGRLPTEPPPNPTAYAAYEDADTLDWLASAGRHMAASRYKTRAEVAKWWRNDPLVVRP